MIPAASRSPQLAIQAAMFARADADAELRQLLGGPKVFDHVPEQATRPYVVMGQALTTPDNTHDGFGHATVVTWHVWSSQRGFQEASRVVDRLCRLFDHQGLDVAGHDVIAVRHQQTQTLRDPDPHIRHVPVSFRVETAQQEE